MSSEPMGPKRIDRRLHGEPIRAHGYTVEPVARLTGYTGFGGSQNGGGGGGWLKLAPQEVIVRNGDGVEQRVALPDPTGSTMASLAKVGAVAAGVSCLVLIFARVPGWIRLARR